MKAPILVLTIFLLAACVSEKSSPSLVEVVNSKISHIDANRRIRIVEDDFHKGDSIYKIRGYFMDDFLQKLVAVMHTNQLERDDYFYFENNEPIFSGHVVVSKKDRLASEHKFYYGKGGFVEHAVYWEDHYTPGKQFPHEHFVPYDHDKDSLREADASRLKYFMSLLDMEGFEIKHLNENLEANTIK